jgi:hypothetical protein
MLMRLRFPGLFLLLSLACFAVALLAQRSFSVDELVTFIKSQIKAKGDDRTTGDYLKKIKLTQRLDERTIEELQGQGAGPRTVAALKVLATESASLPAPPPPAAKLPPKPPPSAAEQAKILEEMRDYAMNYTMGLPNYVCVQTTHRKQDPIEALHRLNYIATGDVIQELLTYFDHKESYTVKMYNGKSMANGDHLQFGGVTSSGEFGTMMNNIFDPENGAELAWQGWHTLRAHSMYGFAYHIDKEHGYPMLERETNKQYTSAYKGVVYWDPEDNAIMRITLETVGIPSDFPIRQVSITLDYDLTKVGEEQFILPLHYQLDSTADKFTAFSEADFKLYRKYGAEATIKFGDTEPTPADQLKEEPQK